MGGAGGKEKKNEFFVFDIRADRVRKVARN